MLTIRHHKKRILEILNARKLKDDGTPGNSFLFPHTTGSHIAQLVRSVEINAYSLDEIVHLAGQIEKEYQPQIDEHERKNTQARMERQEKEGGGIRRVGVPRS